MMLSCCFTGHRAMCKTEQKQILPVLHEKLTEVIERGVTVFRNGGALGFDMLSALCVLGMKQTYPQIRLYIDVPHKNQSDLWKEFEKNVYEYIIERADKVTYVSQQYERGCMQKRNRYMVDHSDCVIAYIRKPKGGSYYTACYAESLGKEVIYL